MHSVFLLNQVSDIGNVMIITFIGNDLIQMDSITVNEEHVME